MNLRKIALQTGEPDLYTLISGGNVTNNTQNFNAPVNAGGISNSGTGSTGDVTIMAQQNAVNQATPLLQELLQKLQALPSSVETEATITDVQEAIKEPKQGIVRRVVGALKLAKEGATDLAALGHTATQMYDGLSDLVDVLPV